MFEEWFCTLPLPETHQGDVILMDNARFHNKKRLREYVRIYKVIIIFLPAYSPDFNQLLEAVSPYTVSAINFWIGLYKIL